MPYQTEWVDPEVFHVVNGTPVYHTYKDGDWNRRMSYWYTLDPTSEDDDFDIRDLDAFCEVEPPAYTEAYNEDDHHKAVLEKAFETGELP